MPNANSPAKKRHFCIISRQQQTHLVKNEAARLGFDACRIAIAAHLPEAADHLEKWLHAGHHAGMAWMENHFDKRTDPRKLVPGAKSVVTLLLNYYPAEAQKPYAPRISRYAFGHDYHTIIRAKLNALLETLRTRIGDIDGRGFVDSAPVLERAWALRSGLGWLGKNANLLTKHSGSYYFLATLITDLDLIPDAPLNVDYCGTCTRCLDACPTQAIIAPGVVDSNKCISYLTIELKDDVIPDELKSRMDGWIFGCDVCQEVCPWNRFAKPHEETLFQPLPEVLNFSTRQWEEISEEMFRSIFKHSPIKRAKWKAMQRNLQQFS